MKISQTLKGHTVSIESRRKMSIAHKGVKLGPRSPEIRLKISLSKRGVPKSLEQRKKISDAQKGKMRPLSEEVKRLKHELSVLHESHAKRLYDAGKSLEEISSETNYAISTLKKYVTKWNKENHF